MAICSRTRQKRRSFCLADLDRVITIQGREIQAPTSGVDYTELFTNKDLPSNCDEDGIAWAMIKTVNGETVFDETNIERVVTHNFTIRYLEGITEESWILFDNRRYDVLTVENLDERNEFLVLKCNVRGVSDNSVNAS